MDAAAVWSTERRDEAGGSGTLGSSNDLEPTLMRDNSIRRADTIVVCFSAFEQAVKCKNLREAVCPSPASRRHS